MPTLFWTPLPHRSVIRISGKDRKAFLQGLLSNDLNRLDREPALWAAMLTPQGRFLFEMFLVQDGDTLLLDVEAGRAQDLVRRLSLYKLRSAVTIEILTDWRVMALPQADFRQIADLPFAFIDPRLSGIGRRLLLPPDAVLPVEPQEQAFSLWDEARIRLGLPDGTRDLEPERSLLLENGFEELNGVSFDKGCYLGQELTARTKYRGLIRKRLIPVLIDGPAPPPSTPILADRAEAGIMRSSCGSLGLALLRLEVMKRPLISADGMPITPILPEWFRIQDLSAD